MKPQRSVALTVHWLLSPAAATCFTQTSKPTVPLPSGRCSAARIAAFRSIIAIMPGVESSLTPSVPPTSVRSRPSTVKSSVRVIPGSSGTRGILWPSVGRPAILPVWP